MHLKFISAPNGSTNATVAPVQQPNPQNPPNTGRQKRGVEIDEKSDRLKRNTDYQDYDYLKTGKAAQYRSASEEMSSENYVMRKKRVIECAFQMVISFSYYFFNVKFE